MMKSADMAMVCRSIADDVVRAARTIMAGSVGINRKVGTNTLVNSDLYKQIEWSIRFNDSDVVINTMFNYYIEFIENGRAPMTGKWPPERAIIKWLRKKHIVSSNRNIRSVAFLIRRAVWRDGYKPRRVLENLSRDVDDRWEREWADSLFSSLIKDLENYFNK